MAKKVTWKLILGGGVSNQASTNFTFHFNQQLVATGVCPHGTATHIGNAVSIPGGREPMETKLATILKDLHEQSQPPDIVVLLLGSKDQGTYSSFKYLADLKYCFQSICVTEANFKPKKKDWNNQDSMRQYVANVAMKANLKFGGINHSVTGVKDWMAKTLVLGSDLTHPGNGAVDNCPSIAAVVSSVEETGGLFTGQLFLQEKSDVSQNENTGPLVSPKLTFQMVRHLKMAFTKALRRWCIRNKRFPENVLYYRDGVAESQYDELERYEVSLLRTAWTEFGKTAPAGVAVPPPKLTTVIATKRHSTRFFPTKKADAMTNENCHPGTLVDSVVTSPYFSDFFLQTQNAIKGTARPCHYYVLNNGMGISMTELEQMVSNIDSKRHSLC